MRMWVMKFIYRTMSPIERHDVLKALKPPTVDELLEDCETDV